MVVVQSNVSLVDMPAGWWPLQAGSGVRLYDQYTYDYAAIYRMQPNVRVCVDFLARNIAQLGLHVFRRVSETDRVRLRDHPLAKLIGQPLPAEYKVTRYRLIESLMADMGIYFNAFWLKLQVDSAGVGGLVRVPPPYVSVKGGLWPTGYEVTLGGQVLKFKPDEIVHFRGYNADSPLVGLSPLETLRRVLAEEHAAGDYREHFWQHAARMHGVITRPRDVPEWSDTARQRFKQEFEALYAGGENSGKTAILEEGMEWKQVEFNAQESEYIAGRKLTQEECARAFHIPLPMVGILEHATFSNIREQHKHLYQDSLGPWLSMIEEELALQLLPAFPDSAGVYVEFNIQEKLQGAFEEQVTAMQSAVGRPWMTADEARARFNMPSLGGDAGELVTPLNVLVGGQASPQDSAPPKGRMENQESRKQSPLPGPPPAAEGGSREQKAETSLRERYERKWAEVLGRHYRRQEAALASASGAAGAGGKALLSDGQWYDQERWDRELGTDLLKLGLLTAGAWAAIVKAKLGLEYDESAFEAAMLPWLEEHSRTQAGYLNDYVRRELDQALADPKYGAPGEALKAVFAAALGVWVARQAASAVTTLANFGALESARAGGLRTKTWRTGKNPRDSHAAMDGVTVGIRETFPNGLRWPGDPRGSADENAGCNCEMSYGGR